MIYILYTYTVYDIVMTMILIMKIVIVIPIMFVLIITIYTYMYTYIYIYTQSLNIPSVWNLRPHVPEYGGKRWDIQPSLASKDVSPGNLQIVGL